METTDAEWLFNWSFVGTPLLFMIERNFSKAIEFADTPPVFALGRIGLAGALLPKKRLVDRFMPRAEIIFIRCLGGDSGSGSTA